MPETEKPFKLSFARKSSSCSGSGSPNSTALQDNLSALLRDAVLIIGSADEKADSASDGACDVPAVEAQ